MLKNSRPYKFLSRNYIYILIVTVIVLLPMCIIMEYTSTTTVISEITVTIDRHEDNYAGNIALYNLTGQVGHLTSPQKTVVVTYNGEEYSIKSDKLYNNYNDGDEITVKLVEKVDKKTGEVLKTEIELGED